VTAAGPAGPVAVSATCPRCGAERIPGATFCEACAFEFLEGPAGAAAVSGVEKPGDESPLDVGWTGPVVPDPRSPGGAPTDQGLEAEQPVCRDCGQGQYEDGYCNQCGAKQPDPRDHYGEAPASWVAGICDIGRRHRRNEDAMAVFAGEPPRSFAALVVCDGVSNSTDSHVASLAASRAAREVLQAPMPHGVGTRSAVVAAAEHRLGEAVLAAQRAVVETTTAAGEAAVDSPPSCTFVAALVVDGTVIAGNVGDSRSYWLPDAPASAALQLGEDDSFAASQMSSGVARKDAESGPGAHAITRWLGVDSPDDLAPHTSDLDLAEDGWLLVCSDGLWNYWSDAEDMRGLVHETVTALGPEGLHPPTLASALTDRANEAGGADNITVVLARIGAVSPASAGPIETAERTEPTKGRTPDEAQSATGTLSEEAPPRDAERAATDPNSSLDTKDTA
jgi:serine/threonine protein phosphatase PrpC